MASAVPELKAAARLLACAVGASLLYVCAALAQHGTVGGEWRAYSGDLGASKYSPLDQIDRSNVARLSIAWRRPALDAAVLARSPRLRAASTFRSTPLMVGGVLYASNGVGFVEAFDAGTGKTLWVEPPLDDGPTGYRGASTRGVGYWKSGNDARVLAQHSEYLLALDAKTGRPIPTFGDNGRVNVSADVGAGFTYTWNGAPFVIGDVVVLGGTPGDEFANKEATRSDVRLTTCAAAAALGFTSSRKRRAWVETGERSGLHWPRARVDALSADADPPSVLADHRVDEPHVWRPPPRRQLV
jgi:glucose dehydrogenase